MDLFKRKGGRSMFAHESAFARRWMCVCAHVCWCACVGVRLFLGDCCSHACAYRITACTSGHDKVLTPRVSQATTAALSSGTSCIEMAGQACILGWLTVLLMDTPP